MAKHTNGTGAHAGGSSQRQTPGISMNASLIISFVLLSVLPVAIALTFAIINSSTQAQQQVANQLNSVADIKGRSLEIALQDSQATLRGVLSESDSQANVVKLLTASGDASALRESVTNDMKAILSGQNASFTEYFVYDTQGNIVASTDENQAGKVVSRQPYFANSFKSEHIQPPYYELNSATLQVIMSRPIFSGDSVVGAIAGRFDMTGLGEVMTQRTGLGDTGETYLVSLENNYLITPSRFEGSPLNRSYHSQGIDAAIAGQDGSAQYVNYRGQPVLGAYRWLPQLQVALLAEMQQDEALAASRQTTLATLAIAIATAVVAIGTGALLALRLARPVAALTVTTRALASGDLATRAQPSGPRETRELSGAFNMMADQLQKTLADLQISVKEARVAETVAHEANRLKSEFLATMSHELRTPLNAMIGFTEIILSGMGGTVDEDAKHMTERIHANSQRLLALINDVLDLSKIEAKRVEVNEQPFSPRQMADDLSSQMASLAEKKGLDFEVEISPSLPDVVSGDRALIERVLTNLLSNAFKFTDQGKVQLSMARTPGQSWSISVRDTGIGIPPHAQEFIFDPFRQLDGTSQRAYGGTGLGLAIVRDLVRAMDGAVKVDSALEQGSTFTVTLPLVPTGEHIPQMEAA